MNRFTEQKQLSNYDSQHIDCDVEVKSTKTHNRLTAAAEKSEKEAKNKKPEMRDKQARSKSSLRKLSFHRGPVIKPGSEN